MAKKNKQELKEKIEAAGKILKLKGIEYDDWLLEIHSNFINENIPLLLSMINNNKDESKEMPTNLV